MSEISTTPIYGDDVLVDAFLTVEQHTTLFGALIEEESQVRIRFAGQFSAEEWARTGSVRPLAAINRSPDRPDCSLYAEDGRYQR